MKMLDPQEIQELRERNDTKSLRIAQEKVNLEKQLELKKDKLRRDFEAYKSILSDEIKSLTTQRDLLLNEVTKLRKEKEEGMTQVYQARGEAQEIIQTAYKRVRDAESIESIVENKMDKLKKRGNNLKKLLST